jgi:hypothetical protein
MSNVNTNLRILKIQSCPSRSGQSILRYHIGCNEEGQLYFRLYSNSGNGFFNNRWVALLDIEAILNDAGTYFTSYALKALYDQQSTNSPAFLLAALIAEGLVHIAQTEKRCYCKADFAAFKVAMQELIDGNTNLDPNQKPPKQTKKRQPLNDEAVIDALLQP